jgi:hypothetical protein
MNTQLSRKERKYTYTPKEKEYKRKYYLRNKESMKLKSRKAYTENKEDKKAKSREFYSKNKVERGIQIKEYRKNNQAKISNYSKALYRKDKRNLLRQNTRNKYKDLKIICQECGSKEELQFHHLKPYKEDNFMVLCRACHLKQHGKEKINYGNN